MVNHGFSVHPKRASAPKGFTLIELLVVIAIITTLMGMLTPVYSRARAQAREVTCLSNSRQVAMAMEMYTQGYDGKLPPSYRDEVYWFQRLEPYAKNPQILHCSESRLDRDVVSYSINRNVDGILRDSARDPSSVIWLGDGYEDGTTVRQVGHFKTAVEASFDPLPDPQKKEPGQVGYRHNMGAVFTYLDGHTHWHPQEAMALPDAEKYWKDESMQ